MQPQPPQITCRPVLHAATDVGDAFGGALQAQRLKSRGEIREKSLRHISQGSV